MITPSFGLTATERVLPKLALDFTTASLDARVTFTRTTGASNPATYVNSGGVLTAATNNQPRFDYDPATLVCKGLLIEETRQNILLYSNDFSNAAWTLTSATLGSSTTSPDGTNNGVLVDVSVNTYNVKRTALLAVTGTYAMSVYLKAGSVSSVNVFLSESTAYRATFNLSTGVVTGVGASVTSASSQDAGNGWWRCTVVAALTSTSAKAGFGLSTTGTFYAYGAQQELGAFPTSYIPTTTTALTRNADVATMTGTNFSDWFNASEGTFVSTATLYSPPINNDVVWQLYTTSSSVDNAITCFQNYGTTSRVRMLGYNGTTNDVSVYPTQTYAANQQIKIAAAYKQNNYALSANGNTTLTDTSGDVPPVVGLRIGSGEGIASYIINGWVAELNYYSQRLTDAELQAFSK